MYIEEDELNELEEGGGRAAEIRARVAPPNAHLCGGGGMPMPGGVGSSGGAIVGVAGPHHYICRTKSGWGWVYEVGKVPQGQHKLLTLT